MFFNSFGFFLFLTVVLAVYHKLGHALGHRAQNRFLIVASCFFYACWDWRFLAPLLFTTGMNYFVAGRMEILAAEGAPRAKLKPLLVLGVSATLGLLGFFKYYNFFSESMRGLLELCGVHASIGTLGVILPVGISFYTFHALSYTIDVYRGTLPAARKIEDFLLSMVFFPYLASGPIQRAGSLLRQVVTPRRTTADQFADGLHLIMWGMFKKVFIADNLSPVVGSVFGMQSPDGFSTLIGVYAFAVQIYCDFSGYTDIARGTAKLMGFEFVLNFNLPYLSASPREFWTRWHISLSTWLRDYLYVSLGGNRHGAAVTARNLILTMVIGGLWHGAAWNFAIWGFFHGAWLVVHRQLQPFIRLPKSAGKGLAAAWKTACIFVTFNLVCYGWLLFRASSFEQIAAMTSSLAHPFMGGDPETAMRLAIIASPLAVVQAVQYFSGRLDFMKSPRLPLEARAAIYAVMAYCVVFRGGEARSFIYSQF